MLAHLETFHATKRHQIQARDLCAAQVGACQVGARKVRRPQTGISILNPALDSHQQPVCKRKVQAQFRVKGAFHAAMGQFCLALAPKHPKITFYRPSSQTPLPTPDTLRHGNRLCLTLRLSRWRLPRSPQGSLFSLLIDALARSSNLSLTKGCSTSRSLKRRSKK